MFNASDVERDVERLGGCLYKALDVDQCSGIEVCDRAYRFCLVKCHPDKPGGSKELSQWFNEIISLLRDPEWKAAYDNVLNPPPPPPPIRLEKRQPKVNKDKVKQSKKDKQLERKKRHVEKEANERSASPVPSPVQKKEKKRKLKKAAKTKPTPEDIALKASEMEAHEARRNADIKKLQQRAAERRASRANPTARANPSVVSNVNATTATKAVVSNKRLRQNGPPRVSFSDGDLMPSVAAQSASTEAAATAATAAASNDMSWLSPDMYAESMVVENTLEQEKFDNMCARALYSTEKYDDVGEPSNASEMRYSSVAAAAASAFTSTSDSVSTGSADFRLAQSLVVDTGDIDLEDTKMPADSSKSTSVTSYATEGQARAKATITSNVAVSTTTTASTGIKKKSKGKGRRSISDNRKEKTISSSYNPQLPVPSDPFENLSTLLQQSLASKDVYAEAMAIYGGQYDEECKGAPILDQLGVGLKELLRKEDDISKVETGQSTYRDNLEKAIVQVAGEDFRKLISFGDAPFANASGACGLNYPTLDEVTRPQQGRGSCNLMNRVSSPCPRLEAQTMPRHMVQCDRKRRNLDYEEQMFTCTSLLQLDACCAAFTPANKTDKEYYKKVDAHCERLGITRRQFFLVNYIFFLQQLKLWNIMHPGKPFPFMTASLMTNLHWMGNIGCTKTFLVYYCGNAWHPEVFWRHFTAAMPIELVREMNGVFGRFFPLISEVNITIEDGALTTAVGDWDGEITEDIREEMRQAKLKGCGKGGQKSGGKRQEAAFHYHIAREDGCDENEALECVSAYLSDKHYGLYLGSLKSAAQRSTAAAFERAFKKLEKTHTGLGNNAFCNSVTHLVVDRLKVGEKKRYLWLLEHYEKDELLQKLKSRSDSHRQTSLNQKRKYENGENNLNKIHDANAKRNADNGVLEATPGNSVQYYCQKRNCSKYLEQLDTTKMTSREDADKNLTKKGGKGNGAFEIRSSGADGTLLHTYTEGGNLPKTIISWFADRYKRTKKKKVTPVKLPGETMLKERLRTPGGGQVVIKLSNGTTHKYWIKKLEPTKFLAIIPAHCLGCKSGGMALVNQADKYRTIEWSVLKRRWKSRGYCPDVDSSESDAEL